MTLLLVIFICGLIVTGCNSSADDKTDVYGSLLFENPDSLLQVVTSTDTAGMSEADRHVYDMMYTAAMYRTSICSEDTSVISECEDYFITKKDLYHTALAKLVSAENAYNSFDYYKAITKLMEAVEIAETTDNNALKCDLFNLLYRINSETGCSERAVYACRKAEEYALKSRIVNQIVMTRNNKASMLISDDKLHEARKILDENASLVEKADRRRKSEYYRVRGVYMLGCDSVAEARSLLKKAETTMPDAETFYDIARMYLKTGQADSCLNYCHFAITADRRGYVSIKAYNIIVQNFSNLMGKSTLIRICNDLNTLYLKRAGADDVIKIEALQKDDEGDNNALWYVIVFIVLITAIVIIVLLKTRKNHAESVANGDGILMNEQIVYELHKLSSQGRTPSQEQWIMLYSAANKHIPFFLENLRKINDLSARDINICLLTRLHFSPSETATLTDISPQSVTNSRARLLTKIFGIKGGAAEFDRRICSMK